jgi:hypothetical protein
MARINSGVAELMAKRDRDFAFMEGENKALRDSLHASAGAASRLGVKRPEDISAEDIDTYKLRKDPPDPAIQDALHAKAKAIPNAFVSPAEQQLLKHVPPESADPIEKDFFKLELLRVRRDNPAPVRLAYAGKHVLPIDHISSSVLPPAGTRTWQEPLFPRHFNWGDGLTSAERDYLSGTPSSIQFGGALGFTTLSQSAPSKRPDQISSKEEYRRCTERLMKFMVASNRWSKLEEDLHRVHYDFVVTLFDAHSASDVMNYDEEVRAYNHRHGVHNWQLHPDLKVKWLDEARSSAGSAAASSAPDQSLESDKILTQLLAEMRRNSGGGGGGSGGGGKGKGKVKGKGNGRDREQRRRVFMARPCNKLKKAPDGKFICRLWNWNRPVNGSPCTDAECALSTPAAHICSYCGAKHRVINCGKYKDDHPDDLQLGYGM